MTMEVSEYFDLITINVNSDLLLRGEYRLNTDYYEALLTSNSFHQTDTFLLDEQAMVFHPGITKREYIDSKDFGIPFLSTSDLQFYEAADNKYVSTSTSKKLEDYIVKENTILISRSGTIGNISLVDKNINNCAVTEHAIRIVLNDTNFIGLVYTFLNSEVGQKIIKGQKSGAVIDEIYDEDIAKLQIPNINSETVLKLNELVQTAKRNREKAFELIQQARSLVLQYNNLPLLSEIKNKTIDPNNEVDVYTVNTSEFTNYFRLDAHFYNPVADLVVKNIKLYAKHYRKLNDDITDRVFYLNRFARTFVEKNFGIPYLTGKDIIRIRPSDVSYLSKSETYGLDDYKLNRGWILMTCSGTLGRTCYIWNNYENWVGTHDLIRIVCKEHFDSGYLIAFLGSDYGYYQAIRYKHGAVIDHLTPEQIEEIIIPIPDNNKMKEIGDLVRQAYDLRAEAIQLEDAAQVILTEELTKA